MSYVLALDQGTTSSRSIVFDRNADVVSVGQKEFRQIYPQSGWVEHDPQEIWTSQVETIREALSASRLSGWQISAVGITNQRETVVLWDRRTGEPVYNAIVWQDRRTSAFCNQIRHECSDIVRERTGLEVDAYFSASKLRWLLDNVPGMRRRAERGELAFGTVDSWLEWKLTGGRQHITDVSNASRTMLFNIRTLEWDDELLELFGIPLEVLPEVRSSSEVYGEIDTVEELRGVKIAGIAGDQQAALFGQACFTAGETKNTYGTGCFMLQNVGPTPVASNNRLLTTVAWKIENNVTYALEGSVFIGGAVIQWLRDALGIINDSQEVEALAASVDNNGGVYFVPAFVGLGTPYWNQEARGTIVGITRGAGKAHIARAALESIAFQTADLLDATDADSGSNLTELKVDGGAVKNDLLMQFQADILQIPVVRSKVMETTALGAAYLAGLATGYWTSIDDLKHHWQADAVFEPKIRRDHAADVRRRWADAVSRSLDWAQ